MLTVGQFSLTRSSLVRMLILMPHMMLIAGFQFREHGISCERGFGFLADGQSRRYQQYRSHYRCHEPSHVSINPPLALLLFGSRNNYRRRPPPPPLPPPPRDMPPPPR